MKEKVFDLDVYLDAQSKNILQRINFFGEKLYLEFGGKLFDDEHAKRILPGFEKDSKLRLLLSLKEKAKIIIAISANDIINHKRRADHDLLYEDEVLRLAKSLQGLGLEIAGIVVTKFQRENIVLRFLEKVESLNIKTYFHYNIEEYPHNIDKVVSEDGFGRNEFVEVDSKLVIVTAPGPNSGKMAVCLSQLYHEHKRGVSAGYAKFETFPVHDLDLNDPVNLAYEAATADLNDINMIDPFHLKQYGKVAINYNRDIEVFPILDNILTKIVGKKVYYSPTDMGVNMLRKGIINLEKAHEYSKEEIVRRYYRALCDVKLGFWKKEAVSKIELLLSKNNIDIKMREVVKVANQKEEEYGVPAMSLQLSDGQIVYGKEGPLLSAAGSCFINALKYLAHIDEETHLIDPNIIEPINRLKKEYLGQEKITLNLHETFIAIAVSSSHNPSAALALKKLEELRGCEAHQTVIPDKQTFSFFQNLEINLTSNDNISAESIFLL